MSKRSKAGTPPAENDWIYACPPGLPAPEIAASLDVVGIPVTEVSARTWQQDWQMANSFMDAYGYPKAYQYRPGMPVHWDSFKDWMLVKTSQVERTARGQVASFRFVGELVIVRQSWDADENILAFLLDIMQAHVDSSRKQHHNPHARIVCILEGWEQSTVAGRVAGKRVAWIINPLSPVSFS